MGSGGSGRHASNTAMVGYADIKSSLFNDPTLKRAQQKGKEYWKATQLPEGDPMQMAKQGAARGAAQASQGISSSMASRGGGGVGSALGMQAQAYGNTMTQGIAAGYQGQMAKNAAQVNRYSTGVGMLNQILAQKYGTLTQAYGTYGSVLGAGAQAGATEGVGQSQAWSQAFQGLFSS